MAQLAETEKELRIKDYLHILVCPRCNRTLKLLGDLLQCDSCEAEFDCDEGIPLLFWADQDAQNGDAVTERIRAFYETNPFPDYEEFDDLASLLEKAREGVFARLLDEQIPFGTRVLECGCGTGQLSNFLGIAHRTVIGTDLSVSSLRLAERFRSQHNLGRVFFLQMNLFEPVFPPGSFDLVICNGVLHHTASPRTGLGKLSELIRPGGHLIVGLYHRYGRLMTDLRRSIFRISGNRFSFLDPRIRRVTMGKARRQAWFADQYQNPHESKHTVSEVLLWLQESGLTFVKSIPKTRFNSDFSPQEPLFEPELPGNRFERGIHELAMTFSGSQEGGFFTVIARKPE